MNIWKFKYSVAITECTSFPYAFRAMQTTLKKEIEAGKNKADITKRMSIISPIKDKHDECKVYSYDDAVKMATNQGLLNIDGSLNSKEFKRK